MCLYSEALKCFRYEIFHFQVRCAPRIKFVSLLKFTIGVWYTNLPTLNTTKKILLSLISERGEAQRKRNQAHYDHANDVQVIYIQNDKVFS
jgi:hypothetical protein